MGTTVSGVEWSMGSGISESNRCWKGGMNQSAWDVRCEMWDYMSTIFMMFLFLSKRIHRKSLLLLLLMNDEFYTLYSLQCYCTRSMYFTFGGCWCCARTQHAQNSRQQRDGQWRRGSTAQDLQQRRFHCIVSQCSPFLIECQETMVMMQHSTTTTTTTK